MRARAAISILYDGRVGSLKHCGPAAGRPHWGEDKGHSRGTSARPRNEPLLLSLTPCSPNRPRSPLPTWGDYPPACLRWCWACHGFAATRPLRSVVLGLARHTHPAPTPILDTFVPIPCAGLPAQAVRNLDDLETMACPQKYRSMQTFYKYYSGERVAPYPTLFSETGRLRGLDDTAAATVHV